MPAVGERPAAQGTDGRVKMLGARVPLSLRREWQGHAFRTQDQYRRLTTQDTVPALARLLRDEDVWARFMAELNQ